MNGMTEADTGRTEGEEIPIAAQVVSIVDVYDALTSPESIKKHILMRKRWR